MKIAKSLHQEFFLNFHRIKRYQASGTKRWTSIPACNVVTIIINIDNDWQIANYPVETPTLKNQYQIIIEFNEMNVPEPTTIIHHWSHVMTCYISIKWNNSWQPIVNVIQNLTIRCIQRCTALWWIRAFKVDGIFTLINVLCQNDCILWRIIKRKWKSFSTKNSMHELVERWTLSNMCSWIWLNVKNFTP